MGTKKDCYAYNDIKGTCNALTKLFCKDEKCRFYKTKKELKEQKKRLGMQ